MNRKCKLTSLSLSLVASLATATVPTALAAGSEKPRYTLQDLGVLETGDNSSSFDMNNTGWVAGSSNLVPGGPQHAFLWYGAGSLVDLGTLGGLNSGADGPNVYGEAAIGSELATQDPDNEDVCGYGTHLECQGAFWRHGKLNPLPALAGGRNSNAFEVNNRGQIVGWSENGVADPTCATATPSQVYRFQAVKWAPNGRVHVLNPLQGDTVAFAMGVNDLGQAVGSSGTCSTQGLPPANTTGLHAVLWEPDGTPKYLGTLGDQNHTASNNASSINDRGDVVETSEYTDGTVHSFLWTKAKGMQDLGTLTPAAFATIAGCCRTVNNFDEVVGFSIDPKGMTPFRWKDGHMVDLNTLIPSNSPLRLLGAYSVNDAGEIAGQGCVLPACTEMHAFRLVPKR
jgi:probable HAF family extracellular repeat protein